MKKKTSYIMLGACFLLLAGCTTTKKETAKSSSSSTTVSSTTKKSSESKATSSSKETTTSSSKAPKEDPIEKGKKLLLGKWKTKDPNAHVIVENTYQEDGSYINFSDARGDTSKGTYKVTAFDGEKITISTSLNGLDHTQTYTFEQNNTELTSKDEASGIVEAYVKQ